MIGLLPGEEHAGFVVFDTTRIHAGQAATEAPR